MNKLVLLLTRLADIDQSRFNPAWLLDHVPRVAGLPGLVRYVRNEIVEIVHRDHIVAGPLIADGIEELWFGTAETRDLALAALRSNAWCQACRCIMTVGAMAVSEKIILNRPPAVLQPTKRLSLLTRKTGMTNPTFSNYWQTVHAPLASCHRFVDRYVQNHVLPHVLPDPGISSGAAHLQIDGIGEFLITDLRRMQEDYLSEAGLRMKRDVDNFVGSALTCLVSAREVPLSATL
jgi:hypothetical protein